MNEREVENDSIVFEVLAKSCKDDIRKISNSPYAFYMDRNGLKLSKYDTELDNDVTVSIYSAHDRRRPLDQQIGPVIGVMVEYLALETAQPIRETLYFSGENEEIATLSKSTEQKRQATQDDLKMFYVILSYVRTNHGFDLA